MSRCNHVATVSLALFVCLLAGDHPARANACAGVDLLARMSVETPDGYARIMAEFAAIPNGEGLVWTIEKPGVPDSHLVGTAHVTDDRGLAMLDRIDPYLVGASVLLVELAPDQQTAQVIGRAIVQYGLLPDGRTLDQWLSEAQIAALSAELGRHGIPWEVGRRQRPGLLSTLLALPPCAKQGMLSGEKVLDTLIVERAAAANVPIVGLETAGEQFRAIAALDDEVQLAALLEALEEDGGFAEDLFETTVSLYASGRVAAVGPLVDEMRNRPAARAALGDADRVLVMPRNKLMSERALPYLARGNAVIAVGALHLPGADGLIAYLRNAGFTVRRDPD